MHWSQYSSIPQAIGVSIPEATSPIAPPPATDDPKASKVRPRGEIQKGHLTAHR